MGMCGLWCTCGGQRTTVESVPSTFTWVPWLKLEWSGLYRSAHPVDPSLGLELFILGLLSSQVWGHSHLLLCLAPGFGFGFRKIFAMCARAGAYKARLLSFPQYSFRTPGRSVRRLVGRRSRRPFPPGRSRRPFPPAVSTLPLPYSDPKVSYLLGFSSSTSFWAVLQVLTRGPVRLKDLPAQNGGFP